MFILMPVGPVGGSAPATVHQAVASDGEEISNITIALTNPNLTDSQRQQLTGRLKQLEQKLARDEALVQAAYLPGKSSINVLKVNVT